MEEWKQIEGTKYNFISSNGRLWSTYRKGGFMKTRLDRYGYEKVRLNIKGSKKDFTVHKLVAEYFVPNTHNLETIDHINENKTDNRAENLQWMSRKDNTIKSNIYKIEQYDLEGNYIATFNSCKEAGMYFGAKNGDAITNNINGRTKTSFGFIWKRSGK